MASSQASYRAICGPAVSSVFAFIRSELMSETNRIQKNALGRLISTGKHNRIIKGCLMSMCCNDRKHSKSVMNHKQIAIVAYSELIHFSSLIHDDIVEQSGVRRGNPSMNNYYGDFNAALCANMIVGGAAASMAKLGDNFIISTLTKILVDLIEGEVKQLGKPFELIEMDEYLNRCYLKTGSLFANTLKACAYASDISMDEVDLVYNYGRDVGMAYQVLDDTLDYCAPKLGFGKPAFVDIKQGLCTAPLIFAAQQYKEVKVLLKDLCELKQSGCELSETLDPIYLRLMKCIIKSCAIQESTRLAEKLTKTGIDNLSFLQGANYHEAIKNFTNYVVNRKK